MKKLKSITKTIIMLLCVFSMVSITSVKAEAAVKRPYVASECVINLRNETLDIVIRASRDRNSQHIATYTVNMNELLYSRGGSSNSIKSLQATINRIENYELLDVDGIWGPKTEAKLRRFQKYTMGFKYEDGICGPDTWDAINREMLKIYNFEVHGRW